MIEELLNNWITPIIKKKKIKQEILAGEIGVNEKTIRRWGLQIDSKNIPFDKLAQCLNMDKDILKKIHHEATRKYTTLNKTLIIEALKVCESIGLTASILIKLKLETIEEAADEIVGWLQKGDIHSLHMNMNRLIKSAVAVIDADRVIDLDLIQKLVGAIALTSMVLYDSDELKKNQSFNVLGVEKAWSLRLALDASLSDLMTGVSAKNSTELQTSGSVKIEQTKEDDVWQRTHEIISRLTTEVSMFNTDCPSLIKTEGDELLPEGGQYLDFRKFCRDRLDPAIFSTNFEDGHCFLYSLQSEPKEVQQRLIDVLPSVRMFICNQDKKVKKSTRILHFQEDQLEPWIANLLFAIKIRREQIELNLPKEEEMMKQDNNDVSTMSFTAKNGNINVAMNNASANQLNSSLADPSSLIEALNKLLAETNPAISEHRQLRGDAKEILEAVENRGEVPEASKSWLQESLKKFNLSDTVKTGTGVVTFLQKVISLM